MSEPEHLDLPDGYDPDGGWSVQEWWDALGDYPRPDEWPRNAETCPHGPIIGAPCLNCATGVATQGCHDCGMGFSCPEHDPVDDFDEQRPADFDDEETRP